MKFEWDSAKAASNFKKHGVRFDEAVTIIQDLLAFIFDDISDSEHEQREIIIGRSALRRMLLVCFIERYKDTIRIISARPATHQEVKDYEENLRKQIP